MTVHTNTNNISTDRPEPPRPVPLLRGVAQLATGRSAGFDLILRTQLDAGDRDPGARPDPIEKAQPRPADEAPARRDETTETKTETKAETTDESAAQGKPTSTGNETTNTSGKPDQLADAEQQPTTGQADANGAGSSQGETAETSAVQPRETASSEKPRATDEAQAERRFIAEHGKRAATLRWDSAGVELTHAAEVDLADRNAQKLMARAGTPAPLARAAAQDARGLTTPANPTDSNKFLENKGQTPLARPEQGRGQDPSQAEPSVAKAAVPASAVAADTARAAPANAARVSSSSAPVAASSVSLQRAETRPGAAASMSRGDLVARLSTINGQSPVPVTAKATTNAIDGIARAMLRTERASKPQAATPAKRNEKNETIRQVQQGLARLIKSSGGQSTVRLTPKALGEVTVRLDIREGVANARFSASNDVARSLLQSGLKDLQAALETRGIRVERLSVDSENVRTPTESARHEARAETQASRTGEHSPGSTVSDRPEADTDSRGGHSGFAGHHPGQGRRDDSSAEDSTRSVDALGSEPLPFDEPLGRDEGWIRLDTVA
ncbi:MAG: flagellar hook-length control protein FliK [Phycisphaerales bacterium]|jgi:flagellar hook-length control protein FliK